MEEENNQKKKKKSDKEIAREEAMRREIEDILSESDSKTGQQILISGLGDIKSENELKEFALGSIPDDPEEKYNVYYNGVEKLLNKFLPKGEAFASARKIIREEKKIFLTRGKKLDNRGIRGADSRMAYIQDMEDLMNLLVKWAFENGNLFDLYNLIREKNVDLGYHKD
jgi:hypothetical protein